MKIDVLQKSGNFSGLEFSPETPYESQQLTQIIEQVSKLKKVVIKHCTINEIETESLIMRIVE